MLRLASIALLMTVAPVIVQAQTTKQKASRTETAKSKAAKSAPAQTPCSQYGTGFVRIPGSDSCIRMGGSIETGVGFNSNRR